ncbi:MAG: co-chaperone GroES [Patescibacteria group bacterium]
MSKIIPVGDHIVVEAVNDQMSSASGIIIPESASKEKPMKGKVVAVGPGKMQENGTRREMEVEVGDVVIFSKYGPNEIKVEGKELLILAASDIYAKIS